MISIQLVDKLYRENGIVTIVKNGRFVKFGNGLEKEKASAVTEGPYKKQFN